MVGGDESQAIWSLLTTTLPENNEALLAEEGKGKGLPDVPELKAGQVWTLACGAQYRWLKDNPAHWASARRICESCGGSEFQLGELGVFLECKGCGESHFYDEPHQMYEQSQLRDLWLKHTGRPLLRIPALRSSVLAERWPAGEIATAIVARLEPCKDAQEARAQFELGKSPNDALLSLEEAVAKTEEEVAYRSLYGSCCLALRSSSAILFSTFGDRDVYLQRLDADTFAYSLFFTDGADATPILLLG